MMLLLRVARSSLPQIWTTIAVMKNSSKNRICTNRPPMMVFSPLFMPYAPEHMMPPPALCIMNDMTSPLMKTLVNDVWRTSEYVSPPVNKIWRPRIR